MKKSHFILSLLIINIITYGIVSAETATSQINKNYQEKISIAKNKIASSTAKSEKFTAAEKRIGKKLDVKRNAVAIKFENAVNSLNDIVTKIESRIAKIEDEGISASSSDELLSTAKTDISNSDKEITNLDKLLYESASSTNKGIKIALKNQSVKTQTMLIKAKNGIADVINSLPIVIDDFSTTTLKQSQNNDSSTTKPLVRTPLKIKK